MKLLLTGFGPFPGAPDNPTGPLVQRLLRSHHLALGTVRRAAHIFPTSYEAVDREFPQLLEREQPDAILMFGLAARSRHVRIETRARNVVSRVLPDVGGHRPLAGAIIPGGVATLSIRTPAQRLLKAVLATGVKAAVSHDAGRYLCNYLCWRASEATSRPRGPRLAAFVHVPKVNGRGIDRPPMTFDELFRAGEAIMLAAVAAARTMR